ncbi:DNA repair-scaffolding protein [Astyanax mexicanus]|uniref:DNA repair-scaffolding protein n=1 Tax=Astyanax mexicanus TaxID=7994 RepID=A0A8T2LV35_ASTMX|nr:DNA repair-scaffolding protein [Astyanax mexicanus]
MPFIKRKRGRRDLRSVSFPLDLQDSFSRRTRRTCEPSKDTRSWERCGESFGETAVIKKLQTAGRKSRALQVLGHSSTPVKRGEGDFVQISWSSSEEEQSDGESQVPLKAPERCRPGPQSSCSYYSRYLRLLSAGADTDDLPTIDSESEHEEQEESSTSKEQIPVMVPDISDCSTSDSDGASEQSSRLDTSSLEPASHRQRSVSEWVRSAQALLQTPPKKTDKTSKTPEDSGKKRRRFESGGLAERLNKLQCRQRSAVSFWKHQSVSSITTVTEERAGVLVLRVQSVREVCGMRAALCERAAERQPCVALFNRDTATQLAPAVGDTICVYPPWQSLIVDGEQHPVILNTHFSQKVISDVKMESSVVCSKVRPSEEKSRPCPLIKCLYPSEKIITSIQKSSPEKQVCALTRREAGDVYESLLDVVEASGPSGSLSGPVQVVVQRVYVVPVRRSTTTSFLSHKTTSKTLSRQTAEQHIIRLCMLVQDVYGMFSEVELQHVSSEEELQHYTEMLEGKECVLTGLKVIQRLTRERCSQLFSLIDSLWPPLVSLRVHGEPSCCQSSQISAPSFCYRLAGQQSSVLPAQHMSPLYRPPDIHTLQQILQDKPKSGRCSFKATVVYKREQSAGEDVLLFVTDSSLQSPISTSRTLPVYVSPCCLIQTSVSRVISSPHLRPALVFKDAVIQNGQVFCWGQCVIQLDSDQIQQQNLSEPEPVLLDPLSSESGPCSLCSLSGVVVDVDEQSAFSWPVCSRCGSERLEAVQNRQEAFLCVECGAVDKPTQKMQLEVFLSCPSLSECTVKLKLLQKSIVTLLNSAGSDMGYEVESVLGKEVGPLTAFIHVISRRSALWMSLEEIVL